MSHPSIDPVLIDIPVPITTPRLELRPVMPGDGHHLFAMKEESFGDLLPWMPWAYAERDARSDTLSETVARKAYANFILRTDMTMIGFERATGIPVLMTGLHRFDWEARSFEIGFWVRTSAHRKGYATETANALTRFAFEELDARRIMISHAEGNDRSRGVIEKLGYSHEAYRRDDARFPDGRMMSHHEYVRFDTDNLPPLDVRWPNDMR